MTDKAAGDPKPPAAPAPKRAMGGMGRGGMRNRSPIKLVAALRGTGRLVWPDGDVEAVYELDVFSGGVIVIANGNLEGDFSALPLAAEGEEPPVVEVSLLLMGGRKVRLDIKAMEKDWIEFDVLDAASLADLSANASHDQHKD
jgi:hypothetical protein